MNPCTAVAREHGCTCREQDEAPGYKIDMVGCPIHGQSLLLAPDAGFTFDRNAPRAPTRAGVAYVSAAAFTLYSDRPPIEEKEETWRGILSESVARASQISPIATLFPAEITGRIAPPTFVTADGVWRATNIAAYHSKPTDLIPPCVLSVFRKASVQNAAVYLDDGQICTMVYEMHRPNDRPSTQPDELIHTRRRIRRFTNDAAYLFIASAGSHNWGHWLTDDLPRVAAAAFLRKQMPDRKVEILLLSFGAGIDEARRQSIKDHPDLQDVGVTFLERFVAYQFEELYYASPVSYHPTLKLRGAVDYVRRSYTTRNVVGSRKLYVTRPADNIRALANTAEVENHMRQAGFEIIDCSSMPFEDQLQLFSQAGIVVGVMGAAMTNTIFSPQGTQVVHLACHDWLEPYYWDLADVCGHRCTYIFGPSSETEARPAHFSRFHIDVETIDRAVGTS